VKQIAVFDRAIRRLAKADAVARRLMTVPGVGPVVALAYMAVIDDPGRFAHARDVGAYLGLTPQRYQSGEVDLAGRISKCGDGFVRTCLYEAAGVLLTKVQRWSPLKAWGIRLLKRVGAKKAKARRCAQAGCHPALYLDGRHGLLVDEAGRDGLSARPPRAPRKRGLSLPGRRVEMTAHRALFAGTIITGQFASLHCSIATP